MTKVECTCLYCKKVFIPKTSQVGKYCSRKCKSFSQRKLVECQCKYCRNIFTVTLSKFNHGGGKFCTRQCSAKFMTRKVQVTCTCGKIFLAYPSNLIKGNDKYCSRECYAKDHSLNMRGQNNPVWRGGGTNYYRGDNWQQQRRLARLRDGNICQYCHRKPKKGERKFSIHHIKPFRDFNSDYIAANDLSNLITLCDQCHSKAEYGKIPVPKRLL